MAVKARATITISWINDIKSVTKYYLLQSSTASAPSKPTANPPGGNWVTAEPAFQNGSTNTLYSVELTVFSDDSFDYSDVSKSTSYEAAKEAWNKANNAQNTANSASNKIDNLTIGGRNLIKHGQGDKQKGFFKSFSINGDGYLEASMTSKNTYATIRLDEAFVIKPRDYPVGETYIWSYDIMYTKWDFPEGSTCNALWMGQRYTNAPSGQSCSGQWVRITAHELPRVGSNGCELNKWYHVEQLITIPVQASNNVGVGSNFEFYNPSTTVAASISMRFKNVKLEHGNIATDWTPAPEDSDDNMNELNELVTEQGAVMHVMKDSIESKADKTEVTKLGDDVKTLTSTTNSQFEQMSDSLTATVSSVNQIKSNYKLGVYHRANGDPTKNGCISFARITIKNAWCGTPISFGIISTTKQYYNINVRFKHANTTDPDLDYISCDGNVDVYAHKVGTSTWDILCTKDNGGKSDFVMVSDYIFNSNNTELLSNDTAQTKSIGVKWIDQHYDTPTEAQLNSKEYIKAEQLAGKMTKETITSEVKQTAEGLTVKLNKSYHDTSNYSQLNINTASSWGFDYDNTADGRWYTAKKMARDIPISDYYECLGGEKFKIEFEISTSVKGSSTFGGTDQVFVGTTVEIFGFDDTNKPNSYLLSIPIVSGQSTRIMGTDAATPVKVAGLITIPTKCRRFRVFIQTEGWGNWAGTLKIRNIVVSKINAVSDAASTAQSTANTARTEAANAAKTATNYLEFSDQGLTVGNLTSSALGNNVNISSSSVDIRNGQKVLASYGSDIKMYTNGKEALNINSKSVDIKDGSNILASYGSDIKMYTNGKEALNITKNELIAKALDDNDKTVKSLVYNYTDTDEGKGSTSPLTSFPKKWTISNRTIDMLDESYLLLTLQCSINGKIETKYLLLYFDTKTLIKSLVWDETTNDIVVTDGILNDDNMSSSKRYRTVQRYTEITNSSGDSYNIPTIILDLNTDIEENINGSIRIRNASTINKDMELAPLRIGDMESNDLFLSYNTIFSKSHDTQNVLYIQPDGSPVIFNNESTGIMIRDGGIYTSIADGVNYQEVLRSDLYDDHLYIGRGGFAKVDINSRMQLNISAPTLNLSSQDIRLNGSYAFIPTENTSSWKVSKWNTGFSNYNDSANNAPMYRKYGPVVDFVGVATVTNNVVLANGSNAIIFNLPSGFRPSHDRYFVCQGSSKCIFSLWIRKNGDMEIGRYRDTGNSNWPTVNPGVYLSISATFTI